MCSAYSFKVQIDKNEYALKSSLHSEKIEIKVEPVDTREFNFEKSSDECEQFAEDKESSDTATVINFKGEPKPENKIKCNICNKIFQDKALYNIHLTENHTVRSNINMLKPFSCEYCDKSYSKFSNLKYHKLTHLQIKPFKCDQCGKSFIRKNALQNHMTLHSGNKTHSCNDCGKSFTSSNILYQHKQTHVETRSHICSECNKGFYKKNDLKMHMRVHTKEKPFLCSECGKSFARVTHLNIHFREY